MNLADDGQFKAITRATLGRECRLGQLYDSTNDNLSNHLVILKPTTETKIFKSQKSWYKIDDFYSTCMKQFEITPEQSLSIVLGLHETCPIFDILPSLNDFTKDDVVGVFNCTCLDSESSISNTCETDINLNEATSVQNNYFVKTVTYGKFLVIVFSIKSNETTLQQTTKTKLTLLLSSINLSFENSPKHLLDLLNMESYIEILKLSRMETYVNGVYKISEGWADIRNALLSTIASFEKESSMTLFMKLVPLKAISSVNEPIPHFRSIENDLLNAVDNYIYIFKSFQRRHGKILSPTSLDVLETYTSRATEAKVVMENRRKNIFIALRQNVVEFRHKYDRSLIDKSIQLCENEIQHTKKTSCTLLEFKCFDLLKRIKLSGFIGNVTSCQTINASTFLKHAEVFALLYCFSTVANNFSRDSWEERLKNLEETAKEYRKGVFCYVIECCGECDIFFKFLSNEGCMHISVHHMENGRTLSVNHDLSSSISSKGKTAFSKQSLHKLEDCLGKQLTEQAENPNMDVKNMENNSSENGDSLATNVHNEKPYPSTVKVANFESDEVNTNNNEKSETNRNTNITKTADSIPHMVRERKNLPGFHEAVGNKYCDTSSNDLCLRTHGEEKFQGQDEVNDSLNCESNKTISNVPRNLSERNMQMDDMKVDSTVVASESSIDDEDASMDLDELLAGVEEPPTDGEETSMIWEVSHSEESSTLTNDRETRNGQGFPSDVETSLAIVDQLKVVKVECPAVTEKESPAVKGQISPIGEESLVFATAQLSLLESLENLKLDEVSILNLEHQMPRMHQSEIDQDKLQSVVGCSMASKDEDEIRLTALCSSQCENNSSSSDIEGEVINRTPILEALSDPESKPETKSSTRAERKRNGLNSQRKSEEKQKSKVNRRQLSAEKAENDPSSDLPLAKTDSYATLHKKLERETYLELFCPCTLPVERNESPKLTWFCYKCKSILEWMENGYVICSECGVSKIIDFTFHCGKPSHGNSFLKTSETGYDKYLAGKQYLNILILGESGVGKSTFVNAFANYLTSETLEAAENTDLVSLIHASFTLMDENYESKNIEFGDKDDNESGVIGSSRTKSCRSYVFESQGRAIRLIDTPGVGDTAGVERDNQNFLQILNYITKYPEIHGILLLLKPNDSRMSVFFRFCIQELLKHLSPSASRNIAFVFTNAKSTFYQPGDTYPTLLEMLKSLDGVEIKLNRDNVYCLDNEAFRYLIAAQQGIEFTSREKRDFSKSWDVSVSECRRLLEHLKLLKPHAVSDTLTLNQAKYLIQRLTQPLCVVLKLMCEYITEINRKIWEVESWNGYVSDDQIREFQIPDINLKFKHLSKSPFAICETPSCMSLDNSGHFYSELCHNNCDYDGLCDDFKLGCQLMNALKNCPDCQCPWPTHTHSNYLILHTFFAAPINVPIHRLPNKKKIELLLRELESRLINLNENRSFVISTMAKMHFFASNNSFLPFQDDFEKYLFRLGYIYKFDIRAKRNYRLNEICEHLVQLYSTFKEEVHRLELENRKIELNEISVGTSSLFEIPNFGPVLKEVWQFLKDGDDKCEEVKDTLYYQNKFIF